ncbi:MAG TPA: CoA ester lyase [Epsilonproteobacteria bacterium]|nr:CoA ester lyase [Campylobacterota bacterium]
MIFEETDWITSTPLENIPLHFGTTQKKPCLHKRRRSNMMINPLELKHINSIDALQADMITLNLEDAIAPSRKKEALYNIALFLSNLEFSSSFIVVRTNPFYKGGKEEIAFLNDFGFDGFRLPKITSKKEIKEALSLINKTKELHLTIETKESFLMLEELKLDEQITTVNLGLLDLLSSMGLPHNLIQLDNPTVEYIMAKFLIDTKSANLHPISFMFQQYNDTESFRAWCKKEQKMGFESKACLGPKQVTIANEIFGISEDERNRAFAIKRLFEASSKNNINGFMSENYGYIDEPIYRDALNTLKHIGS